jgi:hypothetical protein
LLSTSFFIDFTHHAFVATSSYRTGQPNTTSHAPNDSFSDDEDPFYGADIVGDNSHSTSSPIIFPHLQWEWQDKRTNKHVTLACILPSGCCENDVSATIQPGGMSVVLTYTWPEMMFQPSRILEIYSSAAGELMYPEESAKSVALSSKVRQMNESAEASGAPFKSTYEVALPFPCQEQFTPIKSRVAEHAGIEFLKVYVEEKKAWIHLLNLEMTGLQSSYQAEAKMIPTRVIKKAGAPPRSTETGAENRTMATPDLSHLLNSLSAALAAGQCQSLQDVATRLQTENGEAAAGSRKRPCPPPVRNAVETVAEKPAGRLGSAADYDV